MVKSHRDDDKFTSDRDKARGVVTHSKCALVAGFFKLMTLPYQVHSDTSYAAAVKAAPRAKLGRDIVLDVIRSAGPRGMTDEEMQLATGLNPSTQRPRRIDLCNSGLVVDGGKKRLTRSLRPATVWEFVSGSVK